MNEDKEKEIVDKALSPKPRKHQNLKTFMYHGLDELINTIQFAYPIVAFLTVVDCDQQDMEGFPVINTRKIRDVKLTTNLTHHYTRRGRYLDTSTNEQWIAYDLAFCMVKAGVVKVKLGHFSTERKGEY